MNALRPAWSLQGYSLYQWNWEATNWMNATSEEADVIIPQQVMALADMGCTIINVIIMWRHRCVCIIRQFLCRGKPFSVIDHGTHQPQSIIHWYRGNIGKWIWHRSTILIAAYAVSGCDTVGCYHGILETKVVKALSTRIELNHLGDRGASLDDVMKQSTHFIGACYGQKSDPSDTMSWVRYKVWVSRLGERGPVSFRN